MRRTIILAVGLVAALSGCTLRGNTDSGTQLSKQAWPQRLAGRELHAVTDRYVLYATDKGVAAGLQQWIDAELAAFRLLCACERRGTGMVLAIEPGDEPVSAIGEWRRQRVDRARSIVWDDPARKYVLRTDSGRPYTLFDEVYFRESFCMPFGDFQSCVNLPGPAPEASWVCFLATPEHLVASFEDAKREAWRAYEKELGEVPWIVVLLNAPSLPLMAAIGEYVCQENLKIDLELLQLQRREALWSELVEAACNDKAGCTRQLEQLRQEIDDEWKALWLKRRVD